MREVEYLFTNSTHISSSPPYERWKMMMKSIAIDRISIQILTTTLSTQNSIYNHVVNSNTTQFDRNITLIFMQSSHTNSIHSSLPDKYDCRSH
mmetsp:Transcript_52335/g.58512  ORF Transcript_52335/g.58512 Transcript_52335/m.58512 type:complete len:93 (-) Transcript_52335:210-488(-)